MNDLKREGLKEVLQRPDLPELKNEFERLAKELDTDAISLGAALLYGRNKIIKDKIYFKRNPNAQRFFINIGSLDGVSARVLMNSITAILDNINPEDFSDVYVRDKYSFFELPSEMTEEVIEKLNGKNVNGRDVRVEVSQKREKK